MRGDKMSVLIKGMKMPQNCTECHVRCRLYLNGRKFRHPNCPLIEVPTPHGRLIDADKIDFRNYAMHDGKGNLIVDNNFINGIVWANDCIDRTPTVIEAEGSKT